MALSVENLHSAVNRKQSTKTLVFYAQDFATTIEESIKAVTKWSIHYFTSRERWYPLLDSAVFSASLQFPRIKKNLSGKTLKSVKCGNGHLSTELVYDNKAVNKRQRWQEQEPFQRTHILRTLHQCVQTMVQTQMKNQ